MTIQTRFNPAGSNIEQTAAILRENEERARGLETVAQLSTAAATIRDVDELLQTVVELTKERFGLYHVHIYLLDEAGEQLALTAGAGEPGRLMKAQGHRIPLRHTRSLVARCARSREAVIVNDVQAAADFLPNKLLPDTRSEMAVPMIVADELIGVLDVQSEQLDRFTEIDVQVKTSLGEQVALAVQHARSFLKLEQARERAELLARLNGALSRAEDEGQILKLLSDFAGHYSAASTAFYFIETDEANQILGLRVAAGFRPDGQPIPLSAFPRTFLSKEDFPMLDLIFAKPNEPTFYEDALHDPSMEDPVAQEYIRALKVSAFILIPLKTGDKWQGLISFRWSEPQHFSAEMREAFAAIIPTASAVTASRRATIVREAALRENEARVRELETVAQVSAAAATMRDVDELLQTVVELTKERFGLYHAHVYLLDEAGEQLVLTAGAGEPGRLMKAQGHRIALRHTRSLVARCARSREAVIVSDVQAAADFLPNKLLPDTRSEMAVPMVVGDQLVGVLDLQSDQVENFTEAKARVMTILGAQTALAVKNIRALLAQTEIAEQLRTVDRLKSEFLASMSHELRTPLNSIIGYSRMLLDGVGGELPEDVLEDLDSIHNGGQHLLSLINDILDLAKIEAGRLEIDPEYVQLHTVGDEVERMTSVLVADKPVAIVFDIDPQLPEVWADRVRLRQILNNLIGNAVKFTERGEVRVSAAYDADMVTVTVSDTGLGIDPERLPHIFERFYQADSSSSRKAGGTGLGLTITQHLVQMHGGRIWATSTLGEGSTFSFTIPITAPTTE